MTKITAKSTRSMFALFNNTVLESRQALNTQTPAKKTYILKLVKQDLDIFLIIFYFLNAAYNYKPIKKLSCMNISSG